MVRLGEHNYNDDGDGARHEDFGVAETVLYPNYKSPEAYHDLALLRLVSKVVMKVRSLYVCLITYVIIRKSSGVYWKKE